ncbi:hypothetical protein ACJX0J_031197 [Zea mays]
MTIKMSHMLEFASLKQELAEEEQEEGCITTLSRLGDAFQSLYMTGNITHLRDDLVIVIAIGNLLFINYFRDPMIDKMGCTILWLHLVKLVIILSNKILLNGGFLDLRNIGISTISF